MAIGYSKNIKKQIHSTQSSDPILLLLEISHQDLSEPVRVVNNTEDIISNDLVFVAAPFEITPPSDISQGQPRALLSIDNVGKLLTSWFEDSDGGDGATVKIMQILHSDPDVIEWQVSLLLINVTMDAFRVRGTLAYKDFLDLPGVALTYRPDTAPGLF